MLNLPSLAEVLKKSYCRASGYKELGNSRLFVAYVFYLINRALQSFEKGRGSRGPVKGNVSQEL